MFRFLFQWKIKNWQVLLLVCVCVCGLFLPEAFCSYDQMIALLGIHPNELKLMSTNHLHTGVYIIIRNCQNLQWFKRRILIQALVKRETGGRGRVGDRKRKRGRENFNTQYTVVSFTCPLDVSFIYANSFI